MNHACELKKLDAVFSDLVPPEDTRDWEHNKYEKQTKTKYPMRTGTVPEVDINSTARGPLVFELDERGTIELEASCVNVIGENMWCRIEKASEKEIEESMAEVNSAPLKYPQEVVKRIRKYQSEAHYNGNNAVYWYFLLNIENTSDKMTLDGDKINVNLYEFLKIDQKPKFPSEVYENDFDIVAFEKYGVTEDPLVEDEHEPIFGSGRYRETHLRVEEQIKIIMDEMFPPSKSSGKLPPLKKTKKFEDFITKIIDDNTAFIKTATQTCAFIEAAAGDATTASITKLLKKQYNDDIYSKYVVPPEYFQDPATHPRKMNKSLYSFEEKKKEFHTVFLNSIVLYTDIMFVLKKYIFDDQKQFFMGSYCTTKQYRDLKEVYEFTIEHLLFMAKQCMDKFGMEAQFDDSGPRRRGATPTRRGEQMWRGGEGQYWVAAEALDYWGSLRAEVKNLYDNAVRGGASISRSDILAFNQKQNNENFLGERALFNDLDRDDVRQILNDNQGIAEFREQLRFLRECGREIDPNWPNGTTRKTTTHGAIPEQQQNKWSLRKIGKLMSTVAFSLIGVTCNMYSLSALVPSNIQDIFMESHDQATDVNATQHGAKRHSTRSLVLGNIANSVIIKQMAWCTSSFIATTADVQHWCSENPLEQLKMFSKLRRTSNSETESWILETYANKPDEQVIKDLKKKLNTKIPVIASVCSGDQQKDLTGLSYARTSERGRLLDIVKNIQKCVKEYKDETYKTLERSRRGDLADKTVQDENALSILAASVYDNYLSEHRSGVIMVTEFQWWLMVLFVGQSITHEGIYSYFQKQLSNVRKQAGLLTPLLLTSVNVAALTFKSYSTTLNATSPMWNQYNFLWFSTLFCSLHGGNKIVQLMIGDDEHVDVSNGQVYIYNDDYSYYSNVQPSDLRFIQQVADTRPEITQNTVPNYIDITFKEYYEWQGKYNLNRVEYIHMPPGTFIKYRPPPNESNSDSRHARIMVIVNSCGAMGSSGSITIFEDFNLADNVDRAGIRLGPYTNGSGLQRIAFCPFVNEFYVIDCNNYGYIENIKQRQLNAAKLFWNALGKCKTCENPCNDIGKAICQECKVVPDLCCYPLDKRNFRIPAIIDLLKQDDIFPFQRRDFQRNIEDRPEMGFLIPLQIRRLDGEEVGGNNIRYSGALWSPIKGFIWVFKGKSEQGQRTRVSFCGVDVDGTFIIRKQDTRLLLTIMDPGGRPLFYYEHEISSEYSTSGNLHFIKRDAPQVQGQF